jgi:hypothetical protein
MYWIYRKAAKPQSRKAAKVAKKRKENIENGGLDSDESARKAVISTLTHRCSSLRPFATFAALRLKISTSDVLVCTWKSRD